MTFLTVAEAAEILRCSTDQVRILIDDGQISAVLNSIGKQRRRYIIPSKSLEEYVARRSTRPVSKSTRRTQPVTRHAV